MQTHYNFLMKPIGILLCSFAVCSFTIAYAQESKTWDYPIHSGTDEWRMLATYEEKLDALNIPESNLLNMNTEDLVKTCLSYPYWILLTTRDNNQLGYNYLRSIFNGIGELEKRNDSGLELLKVYQEMKPGNIIFINSSVDRGKLIFQFKIIEVILSQRPVLLNISEENLVSLLETALEVYEKKNDFMNYYSEYGLTTTA